MFVQQTEEQLIRLGSEVTFLRQMVEELQKQLKAAQEELEIVKAPKRKHVKKEPVNE